MVLTIYIIAAIVITGSIAYYLPFVQHEGKDERGQTILGKSSQIAFIFITSGFVFMISYIQFAEPSVNQIEMAIFIWMAIVWASNSISMFIIGKNI